VQESTGLARRISDFQYVFSKHADGVDSVYTTSSSFKFSTDGVSASSHHKLTVASRLADPPPLSVAVWPLKLKSIVKSSGSKLHPGEQGIGELLAENDEGQNSAESFWPLGMTPRTFSASATSCEQKKSCCPPPVDPRCRSLLTERLYGLPMTWPTHSWRVDSASAVRGHRTRRKANSGYKFCQPLARKVLQVHNPTPSLPVASKMPIVSPSSLKMRPT